MSSCAGSYHTPLGGSQLEGLRALRPKAWFNHQNRPSAQSQGIYPVPELRFPIQKPQCPTTGYFGSLGLHVGVWRPSRPYRKIQPASPTGIDCWTLLGCLRQSLYFPMASRRGTLARTPHRLSPHGPNKSKVPDCDVPRASISRTSQLPLPQIPSNEGHKAPS